jgi:hypothetical protein
MLSPNEGIVMNFANLKPLSAVLLSLSLAAGVGNIACSTSDSGGKAGSGGSGAGGSAGDNAGGGDQKGGSGGSKTGGTSGSKTGGAGGTAATTGGGTVVTLDTFAADSADASCKPIIECCPVATVTGAPKDLAICIAQRKAIGNFTTRSWKPSVDAGYIDFDGAKARACFDAQKALKCGATETELKALDCNYVTSKVALGGTCLIGTDCIEGWCDAMGTKKCTAKKADAAACMNGDECTSGNCKSVANVKTCAPAEAARAIPAICEYFL